MKYFLPDSQDLVDPSFDFETERRSVQRVRQRDDRYAHEIFSGPAYDGILVSKGIVDGQGGSAGRYSMAQRHRLLRRGVREFFRTDLETMGDCGSFTYVKEDEPPYSVDEVLEFYSSCGFNYGIAVDHVILAYDEGLDEETAENAATRAECVRRQELTLELANEFLLQHRKLRLPFQPLGVAQGWSPSSYARAVAQLQKMGYSYIAMGGMVPLRTEQIRDCLQAVDDIRTKKIKLHLLGVTRLESLEAFRDYGVVSFDSTSPLRQAFKDERDNYYTMTRTYTALRVPQVEGNTRLKKKIVAGTVSQENALRLERACLSGLAEHDRGKLRTGPLVERLVEYEQLLGGRKDHSDVYRETLEARPWRSCACDICQRLGYHVAVFRGAERNRRRGLHNVWVFYRRLQRELGAEQATTSAQRAKVALGQ